MAEKHTIAMFKQIDGERKQIGWASPVDPDNGGRTFERSPGFENESLLGVSFEDDPKSQETAEQLEGRESEGIEVEENTVIEPTEEELEALKETDEDENYPQAGDEGKDSAPLQLENNETVELDNGGTITDVADEEDEEEDEEAAFERELAEEQAREAEAPQTRREARESEESN